MGYTVAAPWGEKKNQVQRRCRLTNWNKAPKRFLRVLSPSLVDEMEPPHILFSPAVERQKVKQRNTKQEIKKQKKQKALSM